MSLSLATFNIGAAREERAISIITWLAEMDSIDVFVLTEVSGGKGTLAIVEAFQAAGWNTAAGLSKSERGVLVLSRFALTKLDSSGPIPERIQVVRLNTEPAVTLIGLYIPSRDSSSEKTEKKALFVQYALGVVSQHVMSPTLVAGDFNMVPRDHLPARPRYLSWEYGFFDELSTLNLRDSADLCTDYVHSWWNREGGGFRYDYIYHSPPLIVQACQYDSSPVSVGLSDHGLVAVTIDGVDGVRQGAAPVAPVRPTQSTLF